MTDQPPLFKRQQPQTDLPEVFNSDSSHPNLFVQGVSSGSGFDQLSELELELESFGADLGADVFSEEVDSGQNSNFYSVQRSEVLQVLEPEVYNAELERAWMDIGRKQDLKQPWEKGIWANIFGSASRAEVVSLPEFSRLPAVAKPEGVPAHSPPVPKRRRVDVAPQCWQQVVLNSDVATWEETMEAKLDMSLKRWYDVIICFPTSFTVVAQLAEFKTVPEQLRMVRDVLGSKSPQTLLKRANSMVRYLTYLRGKGVVPPGTEANLYAFFLEQKDTGAPVSRLASVVEAIRFSEHVLGLEIADILLSKRCIGAARRRGDAPVKQAAPLKVVEMETLHGILADESADLWDRCMSGSFLCCVYTRSRWMDLQHSN